MSYKDRWSHCRQFCIWGPTYWGDPIQASVEVTCLDGIIWGQMRWPAQTDCTDTWGSNWGLQARIPTRFQCLLQPSSLSSYMFPVQNIHQASLLSADVSLVKASHSSVKIVGDLREKASTNQKEKPHSLRSHCGKNQHGSHAKGTGQSLKGHMWSCFFLNINNYRNRWEYSSVVAHLSTMCEALGSIPAPPKIK